MEIEKLSHYQYGVLCHTARCSAPIFLMARPNQDDRPSLRFTLKSKHEEVKQLVEYKFMEDVSDEFSEIVREHKLRTGRKFSVYGLTEEGYLMFKDCDNRTIN